jgi:hypothetical protein
MLAWTAYHYTCCHSWRLQKGLSRRLTFTEKGWCGKN